MYLIVYLLSHYFFICLTIFWELKVKGFASLVSPVTRIPALVPRGNHRSPEFVPRGNHRSLEFVPRGNHRSLEFVPRGNHRLPELVPRGNTGPSEEFILGGGLKTAGPWELVTAFLGGTGICSPGHF